MQVADVHFRIVPLCVLPAILQKLVGDFFDFAKRNVAVNLAGTWRDFSHTQNGGSNISGQLSECFS